MKPTIVVVAYSRHESLKRLLSSLVAAEYPDNNIRLIISLDLSDNPRVKEAADSFTWPYGEKVVIMHQEHQGLRNHVLWCGDLTKQYGPVILLEDDLYVSPMFYIYSVKCLECYSEDPRIAGISLYSHRTNVNCDRPFEAISSGGDVYFLQFASSWGQVWTAEQWMSFRQWFEADASKVAPEDNVPEGVINWPGTSWLKYFIKYMIKMDLYFVYPRISLTTNFCEPGTHNQVAHSLYQVPLELELPQGGWRLIGLDQSISVYDSFFELSPKSLSRLTSQFGIRGLTVDLYGTKPVDRIRTPHILTCRPCVNPIASFGCTLKPRDANILLRSPGDRFTLALSANVLDVPFRPEWEIEFDLNILPQRALYSYVIKHLTTRIRRTLVWSVS